MPSSLCFIPAPPQSRPLPAGRKTPLLSPSEGSHSAPPWILPPACLSRGHVDAGSSSSEGRLPDTASRLLALVAELLPEQPAGWPMSWACRGVPEPRADPALPEGREGDRKDAARRGRAHHRSQEGWMRTAAAPGCPAPKWGLACAPRGLSRPIPCTRPDFNSS